MSPIAKYILRNLGTRPFLSALVFGAMVVVGSTMSVVAAVGAGLVQASRSSGHDDWVIVTSRGARMESDSRLAVEDLNTIAASAGVRRVSPEVLVRNHVVIDHALDFVMLRGLEPGGFDMHGIQLVEGRMPARGKNEMIVGEVLLQHFPDLKVGATLGMMSMTFTCVGVFRAPGFLSGEAWTTRAVFQANPMLRTLSVVYLETSSRADAERIAHVLSTSRAIHVAAVPESEFYGRKMREFHYLVRGLAVVFSLVITGAVFAAASLLSVFQLRRLSEQAVMRAMGFRAAAIARLIVYETEALVLPGGAVGIFVAWYVLRDYVVTALSPSMSMVMYRAPLTLPLAAGSMGALFILGLVGTVMPITRMMRTSVTRGLREE